MKKEWRKEEQDLYLPKLKPVLIQIPKMNYFIVDGQGDPNTSKDFEEAIEALYSLSYTVKMMPKSGLVPKGYYDYTVYPLEGEWDLNTPSENPNKINKNDFIYSLMIRQPDFVDQKLALEVTEKVRTKKNPPALNKVRFESIDEGLCVQMMHLGSYDDEYQSFALMDKFCLENNLARISHKHREIYLSDPRKVDPEKRKTVLRYKVKRNN